MIGALIASVLISTGLTTSNVGAELFSLWLEHDLIPKLPAASVLVMDLATFHQRADTSNIVATNGHLREYLPPYSPALNKIEQKWA